MLGTENLAEKETYRSKPWSHRSCWIWNMLTRVQPLHRRKAEKDRESKRRQGQPAPLRRAAGEKGEEKRENGETRRGERGRRPLICVCLRMLPIATPKTSSWCMPQKNRLMFIVVKLMGAGAKRAEERQTIDPATLT